MINNWKRNVVLFLTSQMISLFGSSLVQYAIMWHITLSTESGVMMTISIICGFLPNFFLSPLAGVWADRYNRKRLIILSDGMIALVSLVVAVLFFMGYNAIWILFAVSAVRAVGQGIQTPAVNAVLPQIVPEEKLMRVNALTQSMHSLVMLVSPLISAALLTKTTIDVIFLIDVVTAAAAIGVLTSLIKIPVHAKALQSQKADYFEDLREGLRYIKKNDVVKTFFLYCGIIYILIAPVAFLTPLQVSRSFGDDVWRLSAIEITFSVGMILGGAIIAAWGGFKNKFHTIAFGVVLTGGLTASLGITTNFLIYIVLMALIGVVIPFFNTPATVLLQQKVEEEYLGRVFGVLGMISGSMTPIGMLVFGPLADLIPVEWLLIGTGIPLVLLAVNIFFNRKLVAGGYTKES